MADPDGATEEVHAVALRGAAPDDPEALVAQIEHTRAELARTVDALAERLSPASGLRLLREKLVDQASRPQVQIGAAAVGAAVVGLAVIRIWARHRHASR